MVDGIIVEECVGIRDNITRQGASAKEEGQACSFYITPLMKINQSIP
jgi:hypothetical protein